MSICANPKERRIRIPVGDKTVILIFREYTQKEYNEFMESRFVRGRRGKIIDKSMAARERFVNKLLKGIEAEDADGNPDQVVYLDSQGDQKELTPSVENWTEYVAPDWKIGAALQLEGVDAETEDPEKN